MNRYRVDRGTEFETNFTLDPEPERPGATFPAQSEKEVTHMRNWLARATLAFIGVTLWGAAAMRIVDGDFTAVAATWDALEMPFGIVLGFYFLPRNDR